MLIDTDVIIWNLRGDQRAADFLDQNSGFQISAVTYMELTQGVRDKTELQALKKAIQFWKAEILPIDEQISSRAMFLVESYALEHGLGLADALIGASALQLGENLVTSNDKHYRFIPDLCIEIFRPQRLD